MPFKQKGGMVCVDKKINATERFVPCNKKDEMVYQRDSELYPPLYESSEADIYNLLNPTEVPGAFEYNIVTRTVGPGLVPKAFEKKGKKLNKLGHEINIKERGERAFEVNKLPNYLGKPHDVLTNLGTPIFSTSAFDDFERLNPEGKEYLKQLILTTIRRRVNNKEKRRDIAKAYNTPWPTQEYDRGGLQSPADGITIDTHFASEDTDIDKVNKIYEAIAPNNGYWKPGELEKPLRGGAAAAPPAPAAEEEITFGDFPTASPAPPAADVFTFGDFPPGYLPEFERNPSAMAHDTISQEAFQERFRNRNILDAPPAVDRGGPNVKDFKEGGIHGDMGLVSRERANIVGAPRAHNLEKIFKFAEAIGLQEGDVKRALKKSDIQGDNELEKARQAYYLSLGTGGKRKASKKRRNNRKKKTKKRKSIKKKKKATRR